jgi:transforming growth factor-beta-induced protein
MVGMGAASCSSDINDSAPTTAPASATTAAPATTTAAAAGATTSTTASGPDIVGTALTAGVFTELAGLATDAGLVPTLRGGPFTVFAPTDDAFAKVPVAILHAVQADPKLLATVLTYHVVPGALKVADLKPGPLKTVAGIDLTVTKDGDTTYINGNPIAKGDITASNGVIHVMGDVLVPPIGDISKVATTLPGFATLAKLVTAADLVKTLQGDGPFTVFAPTDDALAKLPADVVKAITSDPALLKKVLTYHVVAGKLSTSDLKEGELKTVSGDSITITKANGVTFVNGNPIAVGNVQATNGVIHVIGDALVPPLGDIVKVATTLPGFSTLAGLVTTAGLVPTLQGAGPFTVFAPTDGAFKSLDSATLAKVQADPALLKRVLTYHVVAGKLTTADLKEGQLKTVSGDSLTVTKKDGVTYLDGVPIVVSNVEATNGIIQVIGKVLVPKG